MVKVKNKRNRNAADKLHKTIKKPNPFEIHINKQKFQVLGQKLKNDRGIPGISRAKAIHKRKKTLLPEFNLKNKVNTFLDRRIGEKNKNMAPEDRIIARFTAERVKMHKKKSIFNLGDDEVLTHKGQTLNDIEKFDDPRSEDEFSDDEGEKRNGGRLDADFVEDAHFGGGVLSNTGKEGAKSRKDLIEQLIAESKKRKAEKQKLREETVQLTEKLDTEWKDLLPLVNKKNKEDEDDKKTQIDDFDKVMRELRFEARGNPTDRLRTEDEIAKEEKKRLEKLEQDRLARMKGFVNEKESKPKHRSADDLDDDFLIESDLEENQNEEEESDNQKSDDENQSDENEEGEEEEEGEADENNEDGDSDNLSDLKGDENSESESDDESKVNDSKEIENDHKSPENDVETNDDGDSDDNLSDLKADETSEWESDEETIQENNKLSKIDIENADSDEADVNSDESLKSESDDEETQTESMTTLERKSKNISKLEEKYLNKTPIENADSDEEDANSAESMKSESDDEETQTESMTTLERKSKNSLKSEEKSLKKTLTENKLSKKDITTEQNSETIKKRRTVLITEENIPNKKLKVETNSDRIMEDLLARKKIMEDARNELPYTFTIPDSYEEFEKLFESKSVTHQTIIIERMIKCTHPSLGELNKEKLSTLFTYLLQYTNDLGSSNTSGVFQFLDHIMPYLYDLTQTIQKDASNAIISVLKEKQINFREKRKKFPQLDTLVLFKMVSLLFPTSDFRHQVVTPALVFMDQLLTWCKVKTRRDIGAGLFLVTHVLEYVSLSKRFLPSVINYLRGLIHLSIPKVTVRAIPIIPPFKQFDSLLVLTEKHKNTNEFRMTADDLIKTDIDDDFKVRTLYIVLKLCLQFYQLYEQLVIRVELFEPILNLLEMLPMANYPKDVKEIHGKLKMELVNGKDERKMAYLVVAAQKPKALRLYEPNIQQVFENRKHRNLPKEKQEHDKLVYKLKKEKKGALREIRRDNAFLSKLKIKKQMESDKERKQKVKEILSGASIQQGELNALDRKRKK